MTDTDELLADERRRLEQLHSELAAQPVIEIVGIVISGSGGGVQHAWSDRWYFHAGFNAWRVRNGALRHERLMLNRACSKAHMIELGKALPEETIVAVRARFCETNARGTPQALLEEVLGPVADDAGLNAALAELLEPVVHVDATLGRLKFEREYDHYVGRLLWRGAHAEITISGERSALPAEHIATAHLLVSEQARWHEAALDRACTDLLELKNDNWLAEGEVSLTREQFRARMKLRSIVLGAEGSMSFWFDDGDLFWGHDICVSGSIDEGFTDATIHG